MHMIRKGQFATDGADMMSFADLFYALAGMVRTVESTQNRRHVSTVPSCFRRHSDAMTAPYHVLEPVAYRSPGSASSFKWNP